MKVAEAIALKLRRDNGQDVDGVYLDTQLFTGSMFLASAICAWLLRSLKAMTLTQRFAAKTRKENSASSEEPIFALDPDQGVLPKRWALHFVKGLVAWKRV